MFNKTRDVMIEEISSGINDLHKIKRSKLIELTSRYVEERDEDGRDPVIDLCRANTLLLRSFLDVTSQEKLNQLKDELSFAIMQENREELEEMFEKEYANFNDSYYREDIMNEY